MRAVERETRALLGSDDIPLQTLENGQPLGPTRYLDFGPGLTATLIGKDYVRVDGAGPGGSGGWDAICDCSLAASIPEERLFKGIGEAIQYCFNTLGMTRRALILVRHHPTSTASTVNRYQETADVTAVPDSVYLFSTSPAGAESLSRVPIWDHNGFNVGGLHWFISGLDINGGQTGAAVPGKTRLFNNGSGYITLQDCVVQNGARMTATSGRYLVGQGPTTLIRCFNNSTGWLAFDEAYDCEFLAAAAGGGLSGTYNPSGGVTGFFVMDNCSVIPAGTITWTLPSGSSYLRLKHEGAGTGGVLTFNVPAVQASTVYLEYNDYLAVSHSVTVGAGGCRVLDLKGHFNNITIGAPEAENWPHRIDCLIQGTADITGPADVNLRLRISSRAIFRGDAVRGDVAADSALSSGTFLNFIGADMCNIVAAGDGRGASGATIPYAFDAASERNLLLFHGLGQWPNPGTDVGTDNRVLPAELGSGGPGGVPGDVFVGVEDEGVNQGAVNNFDFVGAGVTAAVVGNQATVTIPATATVNGHIVEDEGTPLTQRANLNFVGAGVTVTDSAPDTVVTIPGGLPLSGNVSGPASYSTGGFVLDLSGTFPTSLDFLALQLEVEDVDLPPHQIVVTRNSPAAGQATIKVMRHRYDKTTAIGNVTGQPAGVTVQAASGATTAAAQSPGINPTTGVAGLAADDATHSHVDNNIYEHQHGQTHTQTDDASVELAAGTNIAGATWRYMATGS